MTKEGRGRGERARSTTATSAEETEMGEGFEREKQWQRQKAESRTRQRDGGASVHEGCKVCQGAGVRGQVGGAAARKGRPPLNHGCEKKNCGISAKRYRLSTAMKTVGAE